MSNLRNPNIRVRDIKKLMGYKSCDLVWDSGCNKTSEWVLASLENKKYVDNLLNWLAAKNVSPENEALLINDYCEVAKKICWKDVLENPLTYFGENSFQLYDIDLSWVLEYSKLEIARFGWYGIKQKA